MENVRIGRAVRELRRRRRWRQSDLARVAGVSQGTISLVERGHVDGMQLRTMRSVAQALDSMLVVEVRWRGAGLDRLLDERHAVLGGQVASRLQRLGWTVEVEVSYSRYGERGSVDLLGWHAGAAALLVVEVKTELASLEETLRRHDQKVRLARAIALERFGWRARTVGRLLVLPEDTTSRRRVERNARLIRSAYPARGAALRSWLTSPSGPVSGLLFLPPITGARSKCLPATSHRVRAAPNPRS